MISSSSMTRTVPCRAWVIALSLPSCSCVSGGLPWPERQRQYEGRARPFGALARDDAAMLPDDPVRDGEPQPGALPNGFRGEERIVDSREVLDSNAAACIADSHHSLI